MAHNTAGETLEGNSRDGAVLPLCQSEVERGPKFSCMMFLRQPHPSRDEGINESWLLEIFEELFLEKTICTVMAQGSCKGVGGREEDRPTTNLLSS